MLEYLLKPSAPDPKRTADVVFIHGLDGDVFATWRSGPKDDDLWPKWLADEPRYKLGIWSIGYPASNNDWKGYSQRLDMRADNILFSLKTGQLGDRPIFFIAHSLGGLVVKEMLRTAYGSADPAIKAIQEQTKGIVFLATPHAGSRLASVMRRIPFLRPSVSIGDLVYNSPELHKLTRWFRDNYQRLSRSSKVF